MAESYTIPEALLGVHLSTRQSRALSHLPEYSKPAVLEILPITVSRAKVKEDQALMVFTGEEEIARGIEILNETDTPILGFNLFNHAYRALSKDYAIGPLIARSIDLFLGLWQLTNGKSLAENATRTTGAGDLKLTPLMFGNFDDYLPVDGGPARLMDTANLWIKLIDTHRINVGGTIYKLDKETGLKLLGHEPFFKEPQSWARVLLAQGSTLGVAARGHAKYDAKVFRPRYSKFRS